MNEGDQANALSQWTEDLVWVKAKGFVLKPDQPIPLVSSPNLLLPDGLEWLARGGQSSLRDRVHRFRHAGTARRGCGGARLLCDPRSAVADTLVVEAPGVLPELPQVQMGIVARDDLDTRALAPLIKKIEELFSATRQS